LFEEGECFLVPDLEPFFVVRVEAEREDFLDVLDKNGMGPDDALKVMMVE
jgi:hypothetical protein